MFSSHSGNHPFTKHFLSPYFVPGAVVVIRDVLTRSERANQFHFFESLWPDDPVFALFSEIDSQAWLGLSRKEFCR